MRISLIKSLTLIISISLSAGLLAEPVASLPENVSPMEPPTLGECPDEAEVLVSSLRYPNPEDSINVFHVTHNHPLWGGTYSAQDEIIADKAGWYALYSHKTENQMFDSGDLQKNESFFLTVNNGFNPNGKPAAGNCMGYQVAKDVTVVDFDSRNQLMYLGTFYFEQGSNPVSYNHFCTLYSTLGDKDSNCEFIHDTSHFSDGLTTIPPELVTKYKNAYEINPTSLSGHFTSACNEPSYVNAANQVVGQYHQGVNSVHPITLGFCAIPKSISTPSRQTLETPSLNENFESMSIDQMLDTNAWLQTGSGSIDDLEGEAIFRIHLRDTGSPHYNPNRKITDRKWDVKTPAPAGTFKVESDGSGMAYTCDPSGGGFYFAQYVEDLSNTEKLFSKISTSKWKNYEYSGRFKINHSDHSNPEKRVDGEVRIIFHSQAPISNNMNYVLIRNNRTSRIDHRYNVGWRGDPSWTTRKNSFDQTLKSNVYYNFKIKAFTQDFGNRFETKIWEDDGQPEPIDFQMYMDTWKGGSPGGGFVGFGCSNSTSPRGGDAMESVSFDDLKVISIAP